MLPMKSWKTTLAGWLSGAAMVGLEYYATKHVSPQTVVAALGVAGVGTMAKDSNVTGGDVGQPSTPQALTDANQAHSVANPPIVPPAA